MDDPLAPPLTLYSSFVPRLFPLLDVQKKKSGPKFVLLLSDKDRLSSFFPFRITRLHERTMFLDERRKKKKEKKKEESELEHKDTYRSPSRS